MSKAPQRPSKAVTPVETDVFADELAKRVSNIVGRGQSAQVVAQVVEMVAEERFSGPIAHPRHLREYEEILPGSADRIIQMAESAVSHVQQMEARALEADVEDTRAGRRYGFVALCLLIIGAVVATYLGETALALAFLGTGALGTVAAFIKGKKE